MSKKYRSIRFVIATLILLAISGMAFAESSGKYGFSNLFSNFTAQAEETAPTEAVIGVCDTAGPIEIESTGGIVVPTAYPTLAGAFAAIVAGTHTGAINVEVCGNTTETVSAELTASGVGAASYTSVIVRPVGGARIIEGSIVGAVIKLNGADNVTIDGRQGGTGSARDLTVRNNSVATATAAIWLASVAAGNGASNNTVRNLELAGGATQNTLTVNTFGIIMCGITIGTTVNGVDNDNNSFLANRIIRARYGIVTRGTTTDLNISPVVADNIIGPTAFGADQIGKVGIFMQADTGALVSRNTVQFVGGDFASTTAGTDRVGIGIGQESWSMAPGTLTSNTYTVTRNVIHDVIEERTFSSVGLLMATTGGGSNTNNLVANNFVYNVKANGTAGDQAVGLGIAGGLGDRVVFNSVSMTGDVDPDAGAVATTNFSSGIRVGNNSGGTHGNLTLTNNSVFMDLSSSSTATIRNYAISGNAAAFNWGTGGENYNNYYINPINTQLQTGGLGSVAGNTLTTQFATLANWQTAYTTPAAQDANSIQADPQHISTTADLHIAVASPNVNAGNAVTGVTRDIDNQVRVAAPDIGADEPSGTTPAANDIEATTILVPANGGVFPSGTTATPQARFTNVGSATQTSRMVTFTITGPGGFSYTNTQTIASIAVDEAVTVTFATTPTFTTAGTYTMTASTAADSNTTNDSTAGTFNIVAPFTGIYNVGTGETFTSLTNPGGIFAAINAAGATGNITINITSDLAGETGAVTLNEIAGSFTTLIKPSGAARTISGAAPAAGGLLGFNSTDRVTIDGSLAGGTDRSLTVMPSNTTNNGGGIYFASGTNGAQNNVIKNVNVFSNGSLTGTLLGITFASSTFGAVGIDNDNNRIENNNIRGSFYGIAHLGASAANKDTGLVITKNVLSGTGTAGIGRVGIYVIFADGAQITENNIASVSNPGASDTIGIAAGSQGLSATPATTGGISNATIARNYIGVVSNNATFSAVGIYVASDVTGTNNIVNNMVTGVIGNSNAGDIVSGIHINGLAGSTQNVYHNSVSMTGDRLPITANMLPSYALSIATDQPVNVRDNVLVNSQTRTGSTGGGGESYAIGFDGPAANVNLLSNNNDLFVSGVLGQVGITGDLTTALQGGTVGTGTNQTTLAAWQAATTEDAASISVDPLFTSATDLHIPMGSPLVNAGADVMVTTDFDGQTRDAMRDIGADEFVVLVPGTLAFSSATYNVNENVMGGTVTLTVSRTSGSDGAVSVNYATSDGTATGSVACVGSADYFSTSGTLMFANGETSKTFTVAICDDAVFEGNETFSSTLTGATGGATIGMPSTATVTINDNEVGMPGVLQFFNSNFPVNESSTATILVTRTGGSDGAVSVNYATNGTGSATGGAACGGAVDYVTTSGTLNWANGDSATKSFSVTICNDSIDEPNEAAGLALSMPTGGATIGAISLSQITIIDDDVAGSLSINDVTQLEGNAGTSTFAFTVSLSAAGAQSVTVNYQTADGTATAPSDYSAIGSTLLIFNPGETMKTVNVTVNGDTTIEANETFFVNLSMASNATISDGQGQGTITNDDAVSNFNVAISDARITEGNAGMANLTFTVTLTSAMSANELGSIIASVQYATANGTATAGSDYTATSGTLSFGAPGTLTVNVPITGDTNKESNEFFFVNLSMPSMNTTITDNQGAGIIVDNDRPYVADFDRDLKADYSVFRPSTLDWYALQSSNNAVNIGSAGPTSGLPVPGDYDGDGKVDFAVFQASSGVWTVLRSSNNALQTTFWGIAGDKPVQGDYDGDGKTDLAVYRPSTGTWWVLRSSNGSSFAVAFGLNTDLPVQGDYDGDAKTDIAVYRAGTWFVLRSSDNAITTSNWGNATDKPVSGDFDGDGRNDLAIYRAGIWWIVRSLSGTSSVVSFGLATDIPSPADFDGDGSTDIAVYRGSSGDWFVLRSSNQTITGVKWGTTGDVPVPSAYIPQ